MVLYYQTITYTTYIVAVEEIGNSRERVPSSVLEKEQSCVSGVLPGMIMCSSYVCFFSSQCILHARKLNQVPSSLLPWGNEK